MKGIKRYASRKYAFCTVSAHPRKNGMWVKYDEHAKAMEQLVKEIAAFADAHGCPSLAIEIRSRFGGKA